MIVTCIDHFNKMVVLVLLYKSDAQTIANHFFAEIKSYYELLLAISVINTLDLRKLLGRVYKVVEYFLFFQYILSSINRWNG